MKKEGLYVEERLKEFVLNSRQVEENIKRILDYKCERLFQDYLLEHAPDIYRQVDNLNTKQKRINEVYESEVIMLSEVFLEKGLSLINLKGVSLLNEIYPNDKFAYKKRKINDIDILISMDDLQQSLDLLGELGYKVNATNEVVSSKIIPQYLNEVITRGIHFPQFFKTILHQNREFKMKMDCHISILHTIDGKKEKMNNLIETCEVQYFNCGLSPIKVLGLHNRLIHLMVHFVKEAYRCDLRWYIIGERQFWQDYKIQLPLLHEIALVINNNNVDWTALLEQTMYLECLDEVKITMKLLERIYPDLIDYEYIKKTELAKEGNLYKEKYLGLYYCLEIQNVSNIDFLESTISKKAQALMLYFIDNVETSLKLNEAYFISNDKSCDLFNICELSKQDKDSCGEVSFSINDKHFVVTFKGSQLMNAEKIILTFGSAQKSSILSAYINKITFCSLSVSSYGEGDCEISNAYALVKLKGNVNINLDNNIISIRLPLDILGVTKESKYLLFGIGIPSIYPDESAKLKLYSVNDTSKMGIGSVFPFSPRLLNSIKLV